MSRPIRRCVTVVGSLCTVWVRAREIGTDSAEDCPGFASQRGKRSRSRQGCRRAFSWMPPPCAQPEGSHPHLPSSVVTRWRTCSVSTATPSTSAGQRRMASLWTSACSDTPRGGHEKHNVGQYSLALLADLSRPTTSAYLCKDSMVRPISAQHCSRRVFQACSLGTVTVRAADSG